MVTPGFDASLLPALPLGIGLVISGVLALLPPPLARGARHVALAAIAVSLGTTVELWRQGRPLALPLGLYGAALPDASLGASPAAAPVLAPLGLVALLLLGLVALGRRPAERAAALPVVALLLAELLAALQALGPDLATTAVIWVALVGVGGLLACLDDPSAPTDALERLRPWLGLALVGALLLTLAAADGPARAPALVLAGALAAGLPPFGPWLGRVPPEGDAMAIADGVLPLLGVGFAARGLALAPEGPGLIALLLLLGGGGALVAARAAANDDEPGAFLRAVGRADAALAFLGVIVGTPQAVAASVLVVAVGVLARALARREGGWPRWVGQTSLAGFPALAGFAGRWLLLAALVGAGRPVFALVVLLAILLVGYGVFRGAAARAASLPGRLATARVAPGSAIAAAALIGIGLAPGGWLGAAWPDLAGAPGASISPAVVTAAMLVALLPVLLALSPRRPLPARRARKAGPTTAEVLWDATQRLAERAAGPARVIEERYSLAFGLLVAVAALYAFGG